MEFVAIDVETANADISTICQIGIAKFKDNTLTDEWCSLIDPEDYFDPINIYIHGITDKDVKNAPNLKEVSQNIYGFLDNTLTACHTHFDRISIGKSFSKYDLRPPDAKWLDTAMVARRTWSQVAWSGYGLKNVCKIIGYNFQHHDALEDARASGQIFIAAVKKTGLGIEDWHKRVRQPIDPSNIGPIRLNGNPEGALYGENLVFTGTLKIRRRDAAELAQRIGCNVGTGVTKKTTILVVGDQDVTRLASKDKSSKHKKAERLISEGQEIRILRESDFEELVNQADSEAL